MNLYNFIMNKSENQLDVQAIKYERETLTYRDIDKYTKELGYFFKENNINKKSKVGIIVDNPLHFSLLFLSLLLCESVIIPIYKNTGIDKIYEFIEKFHIDYLITDMNLDCCTNSIYLNIKNISYRLYTINHKNAPKLNENIALLMLTSGTTSTPKGVLLSNKNIKSNILSISKYLNLRQNDNVLLIKNLTHISSIVGELLVSLYNTCCIVLSSRIPYAENILRILEHEKINIFFAVPSILNQIIENKNFYKYNLSELKKINFYGSKMQENNINKLFDIFENKNLIYSYGLTEASPRVTFIEKEDLINKPKSSGKPIDNVEIYIYDEFENKLPPFKEGHIIVKGPNVMLGYYNNSNLTKKVIKNNSLYTGDLGYLDSDGFLYVTGRKDNMITRCGKNIHPEEIEEILTSFPSVVDALVVEDTNNNISGLVAYIVKKDINFKIHELLKYCKNKLEDYKIPKKIILIDSLEKTISGKIKRKQF